MIGSAIQLTSLQEGIARGFLEIYLDNEGRTPRRILDDLMALAGSTVYAS